MNETITCPNCRFEIEVSATLSAQLREQLRKEFETEARRKEADLRTREEGIARDRQALEDSRQTLEQEIHKRLNEERPRLQQEAASRAQETMSLEMQDLRNQLTESKEQLDEAHKAELGLRKERRRLEAEKQQWDLEVSRTLDEERQKIRTEARQQADDENRLKEADKEKLIEDLRKQIKDLKRISEQGSQQAQGEVMELELEQLLRQHFHLDAIDPVQKGTHGGDVMQHVHDSTGLGCGTILWESKRTKAWNDAWLPKLRDDQRTARAHVAVLASAEMPRGLPQFGFIDGVWVTNRTCLLGLAVALRSGLIEVARTRQVLDGRKTKVELVYNYCSGPEFRQRIEGIVEPLMHLKNNLESEKRSVHRLWAKREKQLDRALVSAAGLHGDLGGIVGASMPEIPDLELPALDGEPSPLEPVSALDDSDPF